MTELALARLVSTDEDRLAKAIIILSRNGEFRDNDKRFGENLHSWLAERGFLSEKQVKAARTLIVPKYISTLKELLTREEGC